tara:strand:- start:3501 stop:5357 length:1857 start_codon:yes stop_codon:yes gene_type:complete
MNLLVRLLNLQRLYKQLIVFFIDINLSVLSCYFSIYVKYNNLQIPNFNTSNLILITTISFIPFFIVFGLYREVFRYSGINSIKNIFIASFLYGISILSFYILISLNFPISVILLQILFFFILISIFRLALPSFIFQISTKQINQDLINKHNAIIYGCGSHGIRALKLIDKFNLICFIDDDPNKWNLKINGLTIYDPTKIDKIINEHKITRILISIANINYIKRRSILENFEKFNVGIIFLNESKDTDEDVYNFENNLLNIEDINPRNLYSYNNLSKLIKEKVVLISGAGGSIGSELSKQILSSKPNLIILIDNSEINLYNISISLENLNKKINQNTKIISKLIDIRDKNSIINIYKLYKPEIIFHAAAYKHVSIVEENISESVKTNILGTNNLLENLHHTNCRRFVFISSDKAVRPTNFMGATKRFSEMLIQNYSQQSVNEISTIFSIVRFGNVFRSTGSVIPLFDQQILQGGPITVTDPKVTRYFMSVKEAAHLVLLACEISNGGEVFVLNMGNPINIMKIAEKMIKLSGKTIKNIEYPDGEIEIKITGLKSGEKLHEELLIGNNLLNTSNKDIFIASEIFASKDQIDQTLNNLKDKIYDMDENNIRDIVFKCIEKN